MKLNLSKLKIIFEHFFANWKFVIMAINYVLVLYVESLTVYIIISLATCNNIENDLLSLSNSKLFDELWR